VQSYDSLKTSVIKTKQKISSVIKNDSRSLIILLVPLFWPIINIRRMTHSLTSIRSFKVLGHGGFRQLNTFNDYFYYTQAHNIKENTWSGRSATIGKGNFRISSWWQLTYASTILFSRYRKQYVFTSMLLFLASIIVIGYMSDNLIRSVLVAIVIFYSTYFYINLFILQNYNALGWIFVPLFFYGIFNDIYILVLFCTLAASFFSFTSVFVMNLFAVTSAIISFNPLPILSCLPSQLKLILHFLRSDRPIYDFTVMATAIGLLTKTAEKVQLKRSFSHYIRMLEYLWFELFCILLAFLLMITHQQEGIYFLVLGAVSLANGTIFRFADEQSLQMTLLSACAPILIVVDNFSIFLISSIFLYVPSIVLNIFEKNERVSKPTAYELFSTNNIENDLNNFLSCLKEGSLVWLVLNNPKGDYFKVFDGARCLFEPLFFVAQHLNIRISPDWYYVYEENFNDAFKTLWATDNNSLPQASRDADYIICFRPLITKWYVLREQFDWQDRPELNNEQLNLFCYAHI
jgi:hypothetical protein